MYTFVAKQPILDAKKNTIAYELLFRNGLTNAYPKNFSPEDATTRLITEQFLSQPIGTLVGDKLSFINFPYKLVVENLIDFLPKDQVVIEILEDCQADDALLESVKQLKSKGFKIALDDFTMSPVWNKFLPYVDIIKFDFKGFSLEQIENYINNTDLTNIQLLAEKIENNQEFLIAKKLGFTLFQGYFFSKPEIVQHKALTPNQIAVMQLMNEVAKDELDYDTIELLLKRDLSLAYKLLRYVNNVSFATSNKITSFRHATVYLGKAELRRFMTLMSATSLGSNELPTELYQISLTRAYFCELLSKFRKNHTDPQEAFLCGLFSLLEPIMGRPISEIIDNMPIPDNVKNAIVDNKGELAFYLNFVRDYEHISFETVKLRAQKMGLNEQTAIEFYQQSIKWATLILKENPN